MISINIIVKILYYIPIFIFSFLLLLCQPICVYIFLLYCCYNKKFNVIKYYIHCCNVLYKILFMKILIFNKYKYNYKLLKIFTDIFDLTFDEIYQNYFNDGCKYDKIEIFKNNNTEIFKHFVTKYYSHFDNTNVYNFLYNSCEYSNIDIFIFLINTFYLTKNDIIKPYDYNCLQICYHKNDKKFFKFIIDFFNIKKKDVMKMLYVYKFNIGYYYYNDYTKIIMYTIKKFKITKNEYTTSVAPRYAFGSIIFTRQKILSYDIALIVINKHMYNKIFKLIYIKK